MASMICPKCGFEQPQAAECGRCGVIIAKVKARSPPVIVADTSGSTSPSSRRTWVLLGGVLVVAAVGVGLWRWQARRASPEPGSAPSREGIRGERLSSGAPGTAPSWEASQRPPAGRATSAPGASASSPRPSGVRPHLGSPAALPAHGRGAPRSPPSECAQFAAALPDPPQRPAREGTSVQWYRGARGYEEARNLLERDGIPMLLYFFTDWCPYCRRFDAQLLSLEEVGGVLARMLAVRVNPEKGSSERTLANRLGVRGYPSLYVVTTAAVAPSKISPYRSRRLRSPGAFVGAIESTVRRQAARAVREGVRLHRAGSSAAGLRKIGQAILLVPRQATSYYWRGVVNAEKPDLLSAVADFRIAMRLRSSYPEAAEYLGRVALRLGCFERALGLFTSVLEAGGGRQARGYYLRAVAHGKAGQPGPARRDAVRACELGYHRACGRQGR